MVVINSTNSAVCHASFWPALRSLRPHRPWYWWDLLPYVPGMHQQCIHMHHMQHFYTCLSIFGVHAKQPFFLHLVQASSSLYSNVYFGAQSRNGLAEVLHSWLQTMRMRMMDMCMCRSWKTSRFRLPDDDCYDSHDGRTLHVDGAKLRFYILEGYC